MERLEKQKQALGENDHIQLVNIAWLITFQHLDNVWFIIQMAAMMPKAITPLPVLDAFDPEVICLVMLC